MRYVALCLLCLGAWISAEGLAVQSEAGTETTTAEADKAAIKALTREFVEGFNSGDVDRLMRFYADAYVDMNMPQPVQTKEERAEYYEKIVARRDTRVSVQPDEIIVSGDYAIVRGTIFLFRLHQGEEQPQRIELRYMEVWRKFGDGWKAIWGMDAEPYPDKK